MDDSEPQQPKHQGPTTGEGLAAITGVIGQGISVNVTLHSQVGSDTMTESYDGSHCFLDQLAAAGIDFDDVTEYLERDGLALAQAAVTVRTPSPAVLAVGVKVDLAHAASMLALGAANRSLRRAPLSDALVAIIFAVLAATCAPATAAAGAMVPGLGGPAAGSGEVFPA